MDNDMTTYRVKKTTEGTMLVDGNNIVPNSTAVNIPDDDKLKSQYVSLYLHIKDIEEALDYVFCISADKSPIVNRSLFISALVCMVKCFQHSGACSALSESSFKRQYPEQYETYRELKDWRNKHFVHDENRMREANAFLIIAPEGHEDIFGGPPSVIWERVEVNYLQEGRRLENVLQAMWSFTAKQFDNTADKITDKYHEKARDELLKLSPGSLTGASFDNPDIQR